jgi:biopolymer transport protein ExbD
LPTAQNRDKVVPSQIVVIIDDKNNIQIGSNQVNIKDAKAAFQDLQDNTGHRFKSVIIKADPKSDYGTILQVMDAAKSVDLTEFGLANKTIEGSKT